MADMGNTGLQRQRRQRTTVADITATRPPDLVDGRSLAQRPDELGVTDITEVSTWEGWRDVAFVLDVYSRVLVGWQIATQLSGPLQPHSPKKARSPTDSKTYYHSARQRLAFKRPPSDEHTPATFYRIKRTT